MRRLVPVVFGFVALAACTGAKSPGRPNAEAVFEAVAPSVVAITNDDTADHEADIKEAEKNLGEDPRAPRHVIDVSTRKEPSPHGTGFMVDGNRIVTAAHVILRPDHLKITTRKGQTVDADLERIDLVRDVAVLKPRTPLEGVPPLKLEEHDLSVGEPVWALGHTGRGFWALSWGMSEGIASGVVEAMGAKLLLFDAAVYPGFSGGPVVTFHDHGHAEVAGVNHAILYTGLSATSASPIFSAVAVSELHAVLDGHAAPIEKTLFDYASAQHQRTYADLFVTDRFMVTKDEHGRPIAHLMGDAKSVDIDKDDTATIPVAAMLFGLPPGTSDLRFEARDPKGNPVASDKSQVKVEAKQRVAFGSAKLSFAVKTEGRYVVVATKDGAEIGRIQVEVEHQDPGEALHAHDLDTADDGKPDVDALVARVGQEDPLVLAGIRSFWVEKSYPRRVSFSWFIRATRGWTGHDVVVAAYVLDDGGHVVGRLDGCYESELRPERSWTCLSSGGMESTALAPKVGSYDIVFTVNERPVAWWPMEATLAQDDASGSDVDRWLQQMRHGQH
jgi:S1-C subfamily serine protease